MPCSLLFPRSCIAVWFFHHSKIKYTSGSDNNPAMIWARGFLPNAIVAIKSILLNNSEWNENLLLGFFLSIFLSFTQILVYLKIKNELPTELIMPRQEQGLHILLCFSITWPELLGMLIAVVNEIYTIERYYAGNLTKIKTRFVHSKRPAQKWHITKKPPIKWQGSWWFEWIFLWCCLWFSF